MKVVIIPIATVATIPDLGMLKLYPHFGLRGPSVLVGLIPFQFGQQTLKNLQTLVPSVSSQG